MEVLNTLLNLPQMTITAVESNDKEVHMVHTTERRTCPQCGQESTELHQNHSRIVRDLPISGKTCYLHFTKRRFFCCQCGKPFSEGLDFVDPYRDYTKRYQDYIYRLVRENNISYVERLEGLSYEVVERIFLLEAKARLPSQPFNDVVRLGLDEIAERKGRGSYDLSFYDLDTGAPLDVLEGRTKKQLLAYLQALPDETSAGIEEVCIDMWRPYAQAVRLALPHARRRSLSCHESRQRRPQAAQKQREKGAAEGGKGVSLRAVEKRGSPQRAAADDLSSGLCRFAPPQAGPSTQRSVSCGL